MATSPNIGLDLPARGSNVGTWDTPVNGDFTIIDTAFGSVTTIALTSAAVTLASSQAQASIIKLTGTLAANVNLTCASIYKFWTIDNQITNSPSSYCVTLTSTSGASVIGLPPGAQDVYYDGTNVRYKSLGQLGEYWDYAGSTVPSWITASTVPPYLNCDGTSFSSAVYPQLANLLGTNTLPDSRGRSRFSLNQGTSRLSSAGAGVDGNTAYAAGGTNGITLGSTNIPTINSGGPNSITVYPLGNSGLYVPYTNIVNGWTGTGFTGGAAVSAYLGTGSVLNVGSVASFSGSNTITVSYINSSPTPLLNASPAYVGGITMIRAGV